MEVTGSAATAYRVFFTHSMTQADLAVVYEASSQGNLSGIESFIAERDWDPAGSLPEKVREEVAKADCLVAFWTAGGQHSDWVNQEIGAAYALGKPIIPIVETGLSLTGLASGLEYIELDREHPQPTFEKLTSYLSRQRLERETQRASEAEQRAATAEKRAALAERRTVEVAIVAGAAVLLLLIVGYLVLQSGALKLRAAPPSLYLPS